jgi:CubicO group peptidase (beta-lactamase class C family)
MTSPYYVWDNFTAWGTSGAHFKPGGINHVGKRKRKFRAEQAALLPVSEWTDLEDLGVDRETLDAFTSFPDVIQSAVVHEGVLYRTDCPTAAGPFPYCDEVRYGVWSVTKSSMMNVAMLRLAQKYGADFIDQPVDPYLSAIPPDDKWEAVTFRHLANMASGFGPDGAPTCYLCDYDRWYVALSKQEKTTQALDYVWFRSPGTLFNYRDQDAYLLGVALDGFLKAHEGPKATVWKMLRREVYRPIGIFHAPTNSTVDPNGSKGHALMAYGHYPTLDDLAKIALLYENHGTWNGKQLLDSSLVSKLLPQDTPPEEALLASSDGSTYYLTNWWLQQMESDDGCTKYFSNMQGWGGNTVTLAPQETVVMRIRNYFYSTPDPRDTINDIIDELTSVCEE